MTSEVGNALRQLGRAEQAAAVLDDGITLFDDSLPRGRAGYLVALADVRTRPGKQCDLDAAAGLGMEAIQLTENLNSSRCVDLIRNLSRQLTPHARVPAVADFLDRALARISTQLVGRKGQANS